MNIRWVGIALMLLLLPWSGRAQLSLKGPLGMHVDVVRFFGGNQAYVELHLYVEGTRLTKVPTPDGQWRSAVDVLLYFQSDGQIVSYDRLQLNGPATDSIGQDFIDIQRYGLPFGTYELVIEAFDVHRTADTLKHRATIELPASQGQWHQSDIMLLMSARPTKEEGAMVRNGYFMEPLPHRFYPRGAQLLYFYQEVYGPASTAEGATYQYNYFVEEWQGDQRRLVQQAIAKKRKTRTLDPILLQMDIRELPSGNYALVTEIRDSSLIVLSSTRVFFQRSNPDFDQKAQSEEGNLVVADSFLIELNEEELNYALRATAARVWDKEVTLLNATIRNKELEAKRQFLLHFFSKENERNPVKAYNEYMEIARTVDEQYRSGFGFGFESDRGFVLMKYGRPNDIIDVEDEPHAPPYQIWAYDEFPYTGQRNVKFLFYNPSLAPGNYLLLHSSARNERQNPRWEIDLYSKLGGNEIRGVNPQDATGVQDQYFRMARKYFEDN